MKWTFAFILISVAACSHRSRENYKDCLKLRVGMSSAEMTRIMGPADETIPFVEGKSPSYLRGRTAYEWTNPETMPAPDHVSVDDASGRIFSIRCSNVDITAEVFLDPAVSTAAAALKTGSK